MAQRNDSLLVALADQSKSRAGVGTYPAQIVDIELTDLADPCAGAVEQLEQCPIPQPLNGGGVAGGEQGLHLRDAERLGKPLRRACRGDGLGDVVAHPSLDEGEFVQIAHSHDGTRHRRGGESPLGKVTGELGDVRAGGSGQIVHATIGQELGILGQVTTIGRDGVVGQATFHDQMLQVVTHLVVDGTVTTSRSASSSWNGSGQRAGARHRSWPARGA